MYLNESDHGGMLPDTGGVEECYPRIMLQPRWKPMPLAPCIQSGPASFKRVTFQ